MKLKVVWNKFTYVSKSSLDGWIVVCDPENESLLLIHPRNNSKAHIRACRIKFARKKLI